DGRDQILKSVGKITPPERVVVVRQLADPLARRLGGQQEHLPEVVLVLAVGGPGSDRLDGPDFLESLPGGSHPVGNFFVPRCHGDPQEAGNRNCPADGQGDRKWPPLGQALVGPALPGDFFPSRPETADHFVVTAEGRREVCQAWADLRAVVAADDRVMDLHLASPGWRAAFAFFCSTLSTNALRS